MRKKYAVQFFIFALLICTITCNSAAAEFVPFVIPARPDAKSPIAVTSYEPIMTGGDRLQADGGHFYRAGKRVRLWGVNLSFGANLPTHEDAPFIAARMAAAGVNSVRCHHLDTSRWPRGIWNAADGKDIAPEALDRLDFFINQLALHGICVNLNLHVGRAHSEYLGLPETNRQYDKISNIFTPGLIDAQKNYARRMLNHVNQYRGVRYADDPAVAFVEITNENSFFMWSSDETLRTLLPYYADILQKQFNAWLVNRYGSNEKLREAWAQGAQQLGEDLLSNGDLQVTGPAGSVPNDWRLEQHEGCRASLSLRQYLSKDALFIEIGKADDTQWHLQLNQGGLSLREGQYYTVIFEAASDRPRQLGCNVGQAGSPWGNLGLSRQAELTDQWQTFSFGFVAGADENNARVNFAFSGSTAPVYLANVQFRPGGRMGLAEGENLDSGSVSLFADNESPRRSSDRMCFLAETEKSYFDGMREFIKSDLGSEALVTGTIVFGPLGLYAQSDMDFIDAHAYWQHPRFPGRPWDSGNWLINQKPMTDFPAEATLFSLAAERLNGKPFTVSEYNHPAPLDSQAECVPMMASFAAAQDWDGVWFYTYSHGTDDWYREHMNSYFDIDTNPAKWGFMRAGTAIFRDNGVGHAERFEFFGLREPSEDLLTSLERLQSRYDRNLADVLKSEMDISWQDMLEMGVSLTFDSQRESKSMQPQITPTKLEWSVEDGRGLYVAQSGAAVLVGHMNRFGQVTDDIRIDNPSYAVITITSLDGLPVGNARKMLITACGRCENTGMKFSEDRQTVGRNWGEAPVQIETVTGTVTLPAGQWKCEALGPDGMPKCEVPLSDGVLKLSPEYGTMWYLLTR